MRQAFSAVVLTLATVAAGGPVRAGQAVEIVLRASAQPDHAQVGLADVAELDGADRALVTQLRAMPLGPAPRSGSVSLNRADIERWIHRRTASHQPELRWSGAQQVEVRAAAQRVASREIAAAARLGLQRWLTERSERSEIAMLAEPADMAVPPGAVRISVREPAERQPRSRMQVWVEVSVDQGFTRSVPVTFSVRAYRTAYVARQDIGTGSAAREAQFDSRQVDVAPMAGGAVAVNASVGERWRVRQPVTSGAVLLSKQVDAAPDVQRGQMATLRTQAGALTVEGVVEVLQDGYAGQLVKARAASSTGVVMARVAGPGLLEMTER